MLPKLTAKQKNLLELEPIEILYKLEQFDFISETVYTQNIQKTHLDKIQLVQCLKCNTNPNNDGLTLNLLKIKNNIPNYKKLLKILIDENDTDQQLIDDISKLSTEELKDLQTISQKFFPFTDSLIQSYVDTKNLVNELSNLNYAQILENKNKYYDIINMAKAFNILIPKASKQFLQAIIDNNNFLSNQTTIQEEYQRFLKQLKNTSDINAFKNIILFTPSIDILNTLTTQQLQLIASFDSNLTAFYELKEIAQNIIKEQAKNKIITCKIELPEIPNNQIANNVFENWIDFPLPYFKINHWNNLIAQEQQAKDKTQTNIEIKRYVDEKELSEYNSKYQNSTNILDIYSNYPVSKEQQAKEHAAKEQQSINDIFVEKHLLHASYSELFINQNIFQNLNDLTIPYAAFETSFYGKLNFLKALRNQDYQFPDQKNLTDFAKNDTYINTVNFYKNLQTQITSINPITLHSIFHNNPNNEELLTNTLNNLNQNELQFLADQNINPIYKKYAQKIINKGDILPVVASAALFISVINLLSRKSQPPKKSPANKKIKIKTQHQEEQSEEIKSLISNLNKV